MSKLADRIKKARRTEPQRIGFAAATAPAGPSLLLVVDLDDPAKANEADGADVVILAGLPAKGQQLPADAVWGVRGESLDRAAVTAAREAGADFAVFGSSADAEALLEEGVGFVLSLGDGADDTRLRLLGDLDLDAIVITAPAQPISFESLLEIRRVAALTRTPLLARIGPDTTTAALQTLRESGVAGVVVDGSALKSLATLREKIAGLPPRGKRREERAEVLIPAQAVTGGDGYDEDDDD